MVCVCAVVDVSDGESDGLADTSGAAEVVFAAAASPTEAAAKQRRANFHGDPDVFLKRLSTSLHPAAHTFTLAITGSRCALQWSATESVK